MLKSEFMDKAKDVEAPVTAPTSQAEVHKGSGFAVSRAAGNPHWYIAECKPTKERVIRTQLEKDDYQVYLACKVEEKVYKSRNRYIKETPVLPGKLFVYTDEKQLMRIMLTYPSVHRFMINRLASDREKARRVYAYITEQQKDYLERVLTNAPRPITITTDKLKLGQEIEITQGPLKGVKGHLASINKSSYLVLKMEMGTTHYIYTEISLQDIQPL